MEKKDPIADGLLIADLIVLYINDKLTHEQFETLKNWVEATPENRLVFEEVIREESIDLTYRKFLTYDSVAAFENVQKSYAAQYSTERRIWPRYFAAASVILLLCTIGYLLLKPKINTPQLLTNAEDRLPVKHGVILTTQEGRKVMLDSQHHGRLSAVAGAEVDYNEHSLTYNKTEADKAPVMHTLTNNSSDKFDLQLADGTQVFLDVASSITYPTFFAGKMRRISIIGQAYLKVMHDAKPFMVKVNDEVIEDLGTEFNINAYPDNATDKITLLEGAVKVKPNAGKSLVLKPGEQVTVNDTRLTVSTADVEAETAWLQNKIVFHRQSLETVLKDVARVYDVQVVWADADLKKIECGGAISRNRKLADILNFIRKTGQVDFSVEGKTVKVIRAKK